MAIVRTKKRSTRKQNTTTFIRPSDLQLKKIVPLTNNQSKAFSDYDAGQNLFLSGFPGTGKTFLALYLGLETLQDSKDYDRVVIVRSAVPTRNTGFLPGNNVEKAKIYEEPYINICNDLYERGDAYSILKQKGKVEFITTSYIRGITLDNVILILDEIQNFSKQEWFSVLTRVGKNCRIIICGDNLQDDLTDPRYKTESGYFELMRVAEKMKSISITKFEIQDIVRSGFIKELLIAMSKG